MRRQRSRPSKKDRLLLSAQHLVSLPKSVAVLEDMVAKLDTTQPNRSEHRRFLIVCTTFSGINNSCPHPGRTTIPLISLVCAL